MFDFLKNQRPSVMLGISLEGNRLEAVVLRRGNNSVQVQKTLSAPLTLSPLTGDADLVGREIRNHLDTAGIRDKRCAVCIPLAWVLTLQTKLPEMPEADVASFLQIEAERGFPSGQDTLYITTSRSRGPGGEQYAMQMAIPRNHLALLEKVLKAAQLKPVNFSLGVAALQGPGEESAPGLLTLALTTHGIDLQVTGGGGIVALRSLDSAVEVEGTAREIDADLVAREIRITLGQLPGPFGESLRKMKVFGRGDAARQFVKEISPRAETMGLKVELVERASAQQFDQALAPEIALSPALALAANRLAGVASGPNFLPPKVQPWKQMLSSKFSSKKLAWAGAGAAGLFLIVGSVFGYQQWELNKYQAQLDLIASDVKELKEDQDLIRKYRPWFDETYRSLRILTKVTEAFPADPYVWAKTFEIRDLSSVSCTGVAQNNQHYFRVIDELQKNPEVSGLTSDLHGQSPLQFSLNFQWEGVKASGN